MTQVNWESVLGQLNEEFIEEALLSCEQPVSAAPCDEKETNMNRNVKKTSKRLLTVAVAATMVMALAVVGFATDALPSLIGRLGSGHFADINPERDAFYQMAGEKSDKTAETVYPETEQMLSLTKEESYYDGEKLVLAYTLNTEEASLSFDFGPDHEYFGELFTPPEHNRTSLSQVFIDLGLTNADYLKAEAKLLADGAVGFTVRYAGIGDHVKLADGTDLGPMVGGRGSDDVMILENQNVLPEQAQNQDSITVQLGVKEYVHYYYVEDGVVSYYCPVAEAEWIPFTIENVNAE